MTDKDTVETVEAKQLRDGMQQLTDEAQQLRDKTLKDIERKVGCLYQYMWASIVIGIIYLVLDWLGFF